MLRYQSIGNGYQWSYNWLLAFTSEEHLGEQIQLDSDIGRRLDGISFGKAISTFKTHMSLSNCYALMYALFKYHTLPFPWPVVIFRVNPDKLSVTHVKKLVLPVVLQKVGLYVTNSFPCQQTLALDWCNPEMGAPSLSAILMWTVIAAKDKPALIAIGWEPNLLFKSVCQETWGIRRAGNCCRLSFERNVDRDKGGAGYKTIIIISPRLCVWSSSPSNERR